MKRVSYEGREVKVTGHAKGWYTIEVDGKTAKARLADLPQVVQVQLQSQEVEMAAAKKGKKTPARSGKKAKSVKGAKSSKAQVATGSGVVVRSLEKKDYQYKVAGKTAAGNVAYDCGDKVATMLRGKSIDEVYEITAKHMFSGKKLNGDFAGCTTTDGVVRKLRASLKDANVGRQRMTLGNRLRAVLRAPAN